MNEPNSALAVGASLLTDGLESVAFVLFLENWLDEEDGVTDLSDEMLEILAKKWQQEWLPERSAEHCGDCTKVAGTCIRCVLDDIFANAARILAANRAHK